MNSLLNVTYKLVKLISLTHVKKMHVEIGIDPSTPDKKKRPPNKAFMDQLALKKWIKEKLAGDKLNYIAMGKPVSILYNANDKNVEKAKKNFDKTSFMKDYNDAMDKRAKK